MKVSNLKQLKRSFFLRDAHIVAPELLGKIIECNGIFVRIHETEAYESTEASCHTYDNRKTPKILDMYLEGGHAYVYRSYGIHHCFNIVTGHKEDGQAVLIRGVEPIYSDDSVMNLIKERRIGNKIIKDSKLHELTNGPGKLTQALAMDTSYSGLDMLDYPSSSSLTSSSSSCHIYDDGCIINDFYTTGRVGISKERELPWRFCIESSLYVLKSGNFVKRKDIKSTPISTTTTTTTTTTSTTTTATSTTTAMKMKSIYVNNTQYDHPIKDLDSKPVLKKKRKV